MSQPQVLACLYVHQILVKLLFLIDPKMQRQKNNLAICILAATVGRMHSYMQARNYDL